MKKTIIAILIMLVIVAGVYGIGQITDKTGSGNTAEIEAGIDEIDKYGNITLTTEPQEMKELGYEIADVILVRAGDAEMRMPVGTQYSDADSGEPVCVFKAPDEKHPEERVILSINMGNIASAMGIAEIRTIDADPGYEVVWAEGSDEKTKVYLSLAEKQGYAEEFRMHQLIGTRSNKRDDYPDLTDAEYANFRAVSTKGMGKDILFRSSSPIDPSLNRNREADAMVVDSRIRTVVNMADSEETLENYPDYHSTGYSECNIIALNMVIDVQSDDFRDKLAEGFRFMASNEGPYLIHCVEGKDRTGFAAAILACLMGADAEEVVADYMLTYCNFYGIEPGTEQYDEVADSNIKATLARAFGIESVDDEGVDLAQCAEKYLLEIGLTAEETESLRNNLSKGQ